MADGRGGACVMVVPSHSHHQFLQHWCVAARTSQRICVGSHVHETVSLFVYHLHGGGALALISSTCRSRTRQQHNAPRAATWQNMKRWLRQQCKYTSHAVGWRSAPKTRSTAANSNDSSSRGSSQDKKSGPRSPEAISTKTGLMTSKMLSKPHKSPPRER